ncbi:hypothetical protein [Leptospira mayottensis]|uniref:hypothetical protein n=1 Tax=Leptospira mayottensis TaxID=1137606 RepID=UPI0020B15725|nr:hypothetical protein [Leptospira mayottensis]
MENPIERNGIWKTGTLREKTGGLYRNLMSYRRLQLQRKADSPIKFNQIQNPFVCDSKNVEVPAKFEVFTVLTWFRNVETSSKKHDYYSLRLRILFLILSYFI